MKSWFWNATHIDYKEPNDISKQNKVNHGITI